MEMCKRKKPKLHLLNKIKIVLDLDLPQGVTDEDKIRLICRIEKERRGERKYLGFNITVRVILLEEIHLIFIFH